MKNRNYFCYLVVALLVPLSGQTASEQSLSEKSMRASQILNDVIRVSEPSIPTSLLDRAVCIAALPDTLRGGFIFGARYGQGLVSCRVGNTWSQPSFVKVLGGSWGLQAGLSSVDMVLVFINPNAVDRLSVDNFTLGGEVSVSVGPLGRGAQAETDYQLKSEVYSYSHSRGLFAGLTIGGASFMIDHDSNAIMYRNKSTANQLLTSSGTYAPKALRNFVSALDASAP